MPNGKSIQIENKSKRHPEIIVLKMSILAVVLILPLCFMLFDFCKVRFVYNNKNNVNQTTNVNKPKVRNFEAPLPVANAGDLSAVSPEKIETLFDNLRD